MYDTALLYATLIYNIGGNTSDEHSWGCVILQVPEDVKLVSPEIVKSWRVEDRDKYIDKVLMDILTAHSDKGLTIDDLKTSTLFDRRTVSVHLSNFVARGEVFEELRGRRLRIYKTNGQPVGKPEIVNGDHSDHYFRLYRLKTLDGNFIYIQERELDRFNRDNVRGVVKIRDEEINDFVKKLHTFAIRVADHE